MEPVSKLSEQEVIRKTMNLLAKKHVLTNTNSAISLEDI